VQATNLHDVHLLNVDFLREHVVACVVCEVHVPHALSSQKKKNPMTLHQEKGKGHTIDTGPVYDHTIDIS
jgi:hypothetical protein